MPEPYKVTFGNFARSLVYEDSECRFVFGLEHGLGGVTYLEHHIPQQQYVSHYRAAFERTKEFLLSRGRQVTVHGVYWTPPNLLPSDISERIHLELSQITNLPQCGLDIEKCLVIPTRAEFKSGADAFPWILWIVFACPESSIRIVFDECSSQFGLAKNGDFIGFNGTFVQTLTDLAKALVDISLKQS
jgi:hypothetical protein